MLNNNYHSFKVLSAKDVVYIENTKSQEVICIDRSYYSIRPLTSYQELVDSEILEHKNIDSLLGIIEVEASKYLLVIWGYRDVCRVVDIEIKAITEVDLILLSHTEDNPSAKETLRKHLKRVLSNGFYYSNGFDITRSLQEKEEQKMQSDNQMRFHSIRNCNKDFMWNYHLIDSFITYNIEEKFISCCIYGYATAINLTIQSVPLQFTLISKRLTHQFTIYNKDTGLMELNSNWNSNMNVKGNNKICCNNFIETECITQLKSNVFSFTVCSSTTPLYFNQNKSLDITYNHLKIYFNDLVAKYKNVALVNIFNSTVAEEKEVNKTLDQMIKSMADKAIINMNVDSSALIDSEIFVQNNAPICDSLCIYGRYLNKRIIQKGVFYLVSNNKCDTKNDILMSLAWYYFNKQLELSDIKLGKNNNANISNFKAMNLLVDFTQQSNKTVIEDHDDNLMFLFRKQWENHRKALEYERNPPADNYHLQMINQRILDYIIDDNSIKRKYLQKKSLNIFVGSWNSAGKPPSFANDLTDWFINNINRQTNPNYSPDIIVIGMQEIVKLNASNILIKSNEEKVKQWKALIYKGISNAFPNEEYIPIKDLHLVGILFICFTKKGINPIIEQSVINKTGAYGTMGNKGSCIFSISYHNSSIAFATGHFCAGEKTNDTRISQMNEILNMYLSNALNSKIRFREFNHWFIFGDTNFRVEREYDDAIKHLRLNDPNYLLQHDQFILVKYSNNNNNCFKDVSEGLIKFPPTFKYVIGSDDFDRNKLRTPSWCDRIFYKESNEARLLEYNIVNQIKYSDHRPVYAIFDLNCTQAIENERRIILEEIRGHDDACNQNAFDIETALVDINKLSDNQAIQSSLDTNVNLLGI